LNGVFGYSRPDYLRTLFAQPVFSYDHFRFWSAAKIFTSSSAVGGLIFLCRVLEPDVGKPTRILPDSAEWPEQVMRCRRISTLVALVLSCCASAFAHHVAVVTQKENSIQNLTTAELGKILKSDIRKWPNGREIVVVINRNSTGSMEILQRLTRLPADKAREFMAEHKSVFVVVDSDAQVLEMVSAKAGALGIVPVRAVDGSIKVLKIDGKLPLEKGYLPD
jgi:hypothetical protein